MQLTNAAPAACLTVLQKLTPSALYEPSMVTNRTRCCGGVCACALDSSESMATIHASRDMSLCMKTPVTGSALRRRADHAEEGQNSAPEAFTSRGGCCGRKARVRRGL